MNGYFITFRSVTIAQRGEGVLRRNGIRCSLQRTPRWMEQQGCGYCLAVARQDIDTVAALLRRERIDYRKIYLRREDGGAEDVTP